MKMNFKYVMMAAVLTMGFAACSNNDDDAVDNLPVDGAKSFATITLKDNATRVATYEATSDESAIKSVKVYVFNSLKVLEQVEEFAPGATTKTFETTSGTHYFMVVANAPASSALNLPIGSSMAYIAEVISGINETLFSTYTDATNGFFMTSGVYTDNVNSARYYRTIDYVESDLIAETNNVVTIPIGRAMAKVNLTISKTQEEIAGDEGTIDLDKTFYTVVNNPDQMYYFPYFGTLEQFQTPSYNTYNTSVAPSTYWPTLAQLKNATVPAGSAYIYKDIATSNATSNDLKPFYVLENSNRVPTYGNATIISLKTQFIPKTWENNSSGALGETFYRVYNKATEKFVGTSGGFWSTANKSAADLVVAANTTDLILVTYAGATCYYIIPLKNADRLAAPEWYDVVRNHFYDVVINSVTGCGYNKPDGGDGPGVNTEPVDPLDPNTYNVDATIKVKEWIRVIQTENIGIN